MSTPEPRDPPRLEVEEDGAEARVAACGRWLLDTGSAGEALIDEVKLAGKTRIVMDMSRVDALDTAGAWLLHRLRAALEFNGARVELVGLPDYRRQLIEEVEGHVPEPWAPERRRWKFSRIPEAFGRKAVMVYEDTLEGMNILGAVTAGLARGIVNPRNMRFTSILANFDVTGRGAVPIMMLMSFLIGAIIAQQGAFYLRRFGAEIYVVDLVGVLVLREIGVILTAIMFAGRSGSAFTAEIGSMKMREEIDALHVMGMNPVDVLVLPRLIALMLALPMLTFLSDLAALAGAAFVSVTYVGIPFDVFLTELQGAIDFETLMVGIVKAPFMALIIGLVACMEGLKVEGSAESLGRQTTTSVVKSIFMVIVVDGVFAIFFAAIGV